MVVQQENRPGKKKICFSEGEGKFDKRARGEDNGDGHHYYTGEITTC